jgi:hypothetical protein
VPASIATALTRARAPQVLEAMQYIRRLGRDLGSGSPTGAVADPF